MPDREEIARRAYFLSERRRAEGLPGGPAEDWYAAERELVMEGRSRKPKSARRG